MTKEQVNQFLKFAKEGPFPEWGKPTPKRMELLFDLMKHQTTLCAGSIITLVTFYDKFTTLRLWKGLIVVSLFCFTLSIISGIVTQAACIDLVEEDVADYDLAVRVLSVAWGASWKLFLTGLFSLALYALLNAVGLTLW